MYAFDLLKEKVLNIIICNKSNEITRETSNKGAGIYMLYVDDFSDTSIIPFYIGETGDFQKRHEEHLKELLSLNRLQYEHYKNYLIQNYYDGYYKACKIFTYLVNHNCTFNNFHMIVLETIDDIIERKQRELEYINDLYAPFFGFNQLNCISKRMEYLGREKIEPYQKILESDMGNLCLYSEYGFSKFNGYLGKGCFSYSYKKDTILSNPNYIDLFDYKNKIDENIIERNNLRNYIREDCHKEFLKLCNEDISNFFNTNGLKSKEKQESIVNVLLFDDEDAKVQIDNYIKRYSKKQINIIEILLKKYEIQILHLRKEIKKVQERLREIKEENLHLQSIIHEALIPLNSYNSHPLKDLYEKYQFPENNVDNICYINIEYTCFGNNFNREYYPEICKIDYLFIKEGLIKSRSAFVKNSLSNFFENNEVFYIEKWGVFKRTPFDVFLYGNIETQIPVSMEYKNGINELTLKDKPMEDEFDIFKEIDDLIDNKTKVIYTTSGYKSTIQRYANIANKTPNGLLKKLIRASK